MGIDNDKVKGVLYGQAIGDALGLPAEFRSATLLATYYGPGEPHDYKPVNRAASAWKAGEVSDDTEQALCLLDAFLSDGELLPVTVAENFLKWAETNGRGMGNTTWKVLSAPTFLLEPVKTAEAVWESTNRQVAPNGGVMRTSYVGVFQPTDIDWTEEQAVIGCQVTHYDPRCVAGTVALSVAIAKLVTGSSIPEAVQEGIKRGHKYHPDTEKYALMSLDELDLDEGMDDPNYGRGTGRRPPIGYTWKCMGAGFWALRELDATGDSFQNILTAVIRAGGDCDTNGAVAGACLGAALGLSKFPEHLVTGLYDQAALDQRIKKLDTYR